MRRYPSQKSIVLLKNKNNFLPLSNEIKSLLITGPNANVEEVMFGNYNGTPSKAVTPLEGIQNKVGNKIKIVTGRGPGWVDKNLAETITSEYINTPDGEPGLLAQFFKNDNLDSAVAATRIDDKINFSFHGGTEAAPGVPGEHFSARWSGKIKAPVSGEYVFQITGDDGYRLFIDNQSVIEKWRRQAPNTATCTYQFKAGDVKDITVEYFNGYFGGMINLCWHIPGSDPLQETVELAKEVDAVIFIGGLSPRLEGEEMQIDIEGFKGGDRTKIELPQVQIDFLKALKDSGKPVILVVLSGSAVAIPWEAANLDAIVQLWYPGQEGGTALVDVLFGDYNPAGRLPITFYASTKDLPPFEAYDMTNRTYKYFTGKALFPFGYGLSFTTFGYTNLNLPATIKAGDALTVTVDVANTGKRDGEEVVQLYVTDEAASVPVPIRALQGFQRIFLKSGETKTVSFTLQPKQLSLIDDKGKRLVEPGIFKVTVGGCQPIAEPASTSGFISGTVDVTGEVFLIE
jgi:beta-glucosidase